MVEVVEPPLKRELVLVLPDVVVDGLHSGAVTLLTALLKEDSQFTAPVLESLSSLHLDGAHEADVVELVTRSVASARAADLPCILRFLLQHLTAENIPEVLLAVRSGLSQELLATEHSHRADRNAANTGGASAPADEALVLDAILSSLRVRSDLGMLLIGELENAKKAAEQKPIDWWIILALASAADAKSRARAMKLLADRAGRQLLTPTLLRQAIRGHGVALKPHYQLQLSLAGTLVRNPSSALARHVGGSVYAALFEEYAEPYERQEMIGQMLTHAGSGVTCEVDQALSTLVDLATSDPYAVSAFSSFIVGVLDYLDGLSVPQARLAFELFARIAYDADAGGTRLADELHITIRKQLTSSSPRYKSLGVLGGCCLLGRLGARRSGGGAALDAWLDANQQRARAQAGPPMDDTMGGEETFVPGTAAQMDDDSGRGGGGVVGAEEELFVPEGGLDEKRASDASQLLTLMLKHSSAPDGSFGFLLHELSLLAASRTPNGHPELHAALIDMIKECITDSFEAEYLNDIDALPEAPPMVRGVRPQLRLGIDGEEGQICVNLLPLLDADHAGGSRHGLCTLSATFQLLRVCEAASSSGGDLEAVDAVLGCPLYLFDPALLGEGFDTRPQSVRETVCLALFYTVDWLRELVNAFCTQTNRELRVKTLKRLRQLIWMERTLDECLALTPSFRLPAALLDAAGEAKEAERHAKAAAKAREKAAAAAEKAAAKGSAMGKGKAPAAKRRKIEQENSSDEEGGGAHDDAADLGGGVGGAGTSAGGGGSKDGAPAKVVGKKGPKAPPGALPSLSALAKVRPYLRSLSLDVSRLLTFTLDSAEAPESEELEAADYITPPSIHYLIAHTHAHLKLGLTAGAAPVGRGRPAGASAKAAGGGRGIATGQDLAQMELRRLSPASLLERLTPALGSLRAHLNTLAALVPSALSERDVVDDDVAFALDEESDSLSARFVEPALLLSMQTLRLLLESRHLLDDASQHVILKLLHKFGDDSAAVHVSASQAPVESTPSDAGAIEPARAISAAFDFFDVLFSQLPTIALQSELIAVGRALLDTLNRHAPGCEALRERRGRMAALASSCLQRDRADDRDNKTWHDKKPLPNLVKALFDVQASYDAAPRVLLRTWATELLPELEEPSLDADDAQQLSVDGCPLFNKSTAPHFIAILFATLTDEAKKLDLPSGDAWRRAEKKGADADPPLEADEAAEVLDVLKELSEAFVQLVLSTKVVDSKQLNKAVLAHSGRFFALVNKRALPMISFHFKRLNGCALPLLKSLQPATRLLQVHCTRVKEQGQIAALNAAASLKKELEALIFEVKVLLRTHDCGDGFWMGNLKHKDMRGQETSSQMVPAVEKPKGKGKRKAAEVEEEDEDEDEAEAADAEDDGEEEAEEEEEDFD